MRITASTERLDALKRARQSASSTAKIDEAAQEFEAQFIAQMMENMFSTLPVGEAFGGGESEEIYRSMMVNEYGKLIARTGGIGVADHVKREMIRLQEVGGGLHG